MTGDGYTRARLRPDQVIEHVKKPQVTQSPGGLLRQWRPGRCEHLAKYLQARFVAQDVPWYRLPSRAF
jgi:hypothetical protein